MKKVTINLTTALATGLLFIGMSITSCNGGGANSSAANADSSKATASSDDNTLLGAGSTFIYPLFSKQFSEYNKINGLKVNYQSIGSGGGILQITNKTIDFGDSDVPLNDDQTAKTGAPMLHVPMASGAAVVAYNLPDLKDTIEIKCGYLLADIF